MDRDLIGAVADRLTAEGWVGRDLRLPYGVTVTRVTGSGVLLVVQLLPTSFHLLGRRQRRRRPEEHWLRTGVGYGPALDLMPLLTLPARPILVDGFAGSVTVTGPGDEQPAVERIVAAVGEHVAGLAARLPDLAALVDAASGRERLVLLAALGRAEEVRALLAEEQPPGEQTVADRRFARQLARRLEQGLPPAPPVEETLAIVAPAPRPWPDRRTMWAMARTRSRAKRAAYRAVRRRAGRRTRDQFRTLLAAEHRARGLEPDTLEVAIRATTLELRQQPFGVARAAVAHATMLAGVARDFVRMFRTAGAWTGVADPEWLRPPDRAGYRFPTTTRYVAVPLDAHGRGRLEQVRAQVVRRLGPGVLVEAWLTRDPPGRLTVHIGPHPIGTVADDGAYDTAFTAAALFDEDPVLTARIVPDPEPILEIPLPRPRGG